MRIEAKREREKEGENVLSNRRGGVKGRKIGFKEVGGVEVEEISSTLFIDSDEACIKSDFSILSTRLSYRRGSRLLWRGYVSGGCATPRIFWTPFRGWGSLDEVDEYREVLLREYSLAPYFRCNPTFRLIFLSL